MTFAIAFKPLPTSHVPFSELRSSYPEWIEAFLEWESLTGKLDDLKSQRNELVHQPDDVASYLARLHDLYQAAEQRRLRAIAAHLEQYRLGGDPFQHHNMIGHMGAVSEMFSPPITWKHVAESAQYLEPGMKAAEKEKRLLKLDEKIAGLRADLELRQPSWRYLLSDGRVIVDSWQEHAAHWRRLQAHLSGPCSPAGVELDASPADEQTAWQLLKLDQLVNRAGQEPAKPVRTI